MIDVRQIAAASRTCHAALAAFKKRVEVWNLETGELECSFDTNLDSGGERLAISADGEIVSTATYHRHGVSGYIANDGRMIWQRRDLKRPQRLHASPQSRCFYVGFDDHPGHVLDAASGETLCTHRGVRDFNESPFGNALFLDRSEPAVVDADDHKKLFDVTRLAFAFLSVAFAPDRVVVAEVGGYTRCFDLLTGRLLWRLKFAPGSHCLHLTYAVDTTNFFGIVWSYEKGGPKELVRFNEDSTTTTISNLGEVPECCFCRNGAYVITSDYRLVRTSNGSVQHLIA